MNGDSRINLIGSPIDEALKKLPVKVAEGTTTRVNALDLCRPRRNAESQQLRFHTTSRKFT